MHIRCTGTRADDDVLQPATLQLLLGIVAACRQHRVPVVLWCAIPCTGGSQWQQVNIARWGLTAKLQAHWAAFRALWKVFRQLAGAVQEAGGLSCVEWPLRCAYWHDKKVLQLLGGWSKALVHGCMYGLQPIAPDHQDKYLLKAWRISSSSADFAAMLERRCDGSHQHLPIAGAETEPSGYYPEALAHQIHRAAKHFASGFRGALRPTSSTARST